jgi:pimeloyl-ACP methyl ester carboxylesterase
VSWRQRRRRLYRRRPKFAGPPVLLIHAGGMDGRMWRPLVERLEDRYWLIVPDLRGHGTTPLPPEEFSHVDDLLAVLDDLKIERAAVVGASMGGHVALELVTAAPDRVSSLVLMASSLDIDDWSPDIKEYWARENELVEAGDVDAAVELNARIWGRPGETDELVGEMSRTALELHAGVEAPERELTVDLRSISVPTLVVSGGRDFPDFARIADRIATEIPGAQRADVEDAGHLIALERPDEAAELLVAFLDGVG